MQTKHQTHEALQVDVARNDPVDGGEVEFGLHISARNGVKITAKKLVKKMIPSGLHICDIGRQVSVHKLTSHAHRRFHWERMHSQTARGEQQGVRIHGTCRVHTN